MTNKAQLFTTLKDRLIATPINLKTIERYYNQYDDDKIGKNYAAFDKSAYIDIYEISLVVPQKGTRKIFTCEVDIYLNSYVHAQSLSIANTNGVFNEAALVDWDFEQLIITELHDSFGTGITNIQFNKSIEYQKYDMLFVKKLSFTISTCAL